MAAYCKHCGNPVNSNNKFCPHCGAPITRQGGLENNPTDGNGYSPKKKPVWIFLVSAVFLCLLAVIIILLATGTIGGSTEEETTEEETIEEETAGGETTGEVTTGGETIAATTGGETTGETTETTTGERTTGVRTTRGETTSSKPNELYFTNSLNSEVHNFYISPTDSNVWGDAVTDGIIKKGRTVTIDFSRVVNGEGTYDIGAIDENYMNYDLYGVDVHLRDTIVLEGSADSATFTINHEDGTTEIYEAYIYRSGENANELQSN